MFEHFKAFRNVIVTGPHRSGTTICAEMIAHDTGLEVVREERFACASEKGIRICLAAGDRVIQCPMGFDMMPSFSAADIAIVLMRRDLEELAASRRRMWFRGRKKLSDREQNAHNLKRLQNAGLVANRLNHEHVDAAALKYEVWDMWRQQCVLHHPFEIEYRSLEHHALWTANGDRRALGRDWHHRRTGIDEAKTTAGWKAGDHPTRRRR